MVKLVGFSAEYVESITPNERALFFKYYEKDEEERKKQNARGNNPQGPSIGGSIDPMGASI